IEGSIRRSNTQRVARKRVSLATASDLPRRVVANPRRVVMSDGENRILRLPANSGFEPGTDFASMDLSHVRAESDPIDGWTFAEEPLGDKEDPNPQAAMWIARDVGD